MRKAGEIIPEVVSVKEHANNSSVFKMPTVCPSCGAPVFREEGEAVIHCTNADCPAQLLRHLIHFTSRDAMDIEGLGPAVLEQLINAGLISNIVDIYNLDYNAVIQLERIGAKSAENLRASIEKSKENDLSKLITALGIRHIGVSAAKLWQTIIKVLMNSWRRAGKTLRQLTGSAVFWLNQQLSFSRLTTQRK